MRRRTFDLMLSWAGAVLTVVLLVAGGLLFASYRFADTNVHSQLAEQNIFFPAAGDEQFADPAIGPDIEKYAGQQLTTGAQAEAYANHYIAVHLQGVADGKTYSEVSALSRQDPENQELAGQVQTLFRGETLRGLLLNAYAFWTLGQIALWASIAAFAAAAIMGVLTVLGFIHLRRIPAEAEVFAPKVEARAVTVAS
jgi:hypothetical protein